MFKGRDVMKGYTDKGNNKFQWYKMEINLMPSQCLFNGIQQHRTIEKQLLIRNKNYFIIEHIAVF